MSGGDFMSRSEGSICARRGIDDRVTVVRDLWRVIERHGAGAADQLGVNAGYLAKVIERKAEITRDLLVAMYGAGGSRLASGLAPVTDIDALAAKVMAGARPKAASVMTVVEATAAVEKLASVEPAPTKPPPWLRPRPDTADAEHLELVALLKRAVNAIGSNRQAAEFFGWGLSTLGFLKAGNRAFSAAQAERLRAWAAANPEQDAAAVIPLAGTDRGAEEVPPPAPVLPDTADTPTDAVPPASVAAVVSAVAAAPAGCTTPDVALPPTVLPVVDGDAVGRAVLGLQNEADHLARLCDQARVDLAGWEVRRGKLLRAIEALQAVAA